MKNLFRNDSISTTFYGPDMAEMKRLHTLINWVALACIAVLVVGLGTAHCLDMSQNDDMSRVFETLQSGILVVTAATEVVLGLILLGTLASMVRLQKKHGRGE